VSSAFLYVAIVAIWACVLVPRWLRRDSAVTELASEGSYDEAGYWEGEEEPAGDEVPADAELSAREQAPSAKEPPASPASQGDEGDRPAVRHPDPEQSRRRVLAARRRLLGMLLLLAVGATFLALMGLAAWWVVLPPLLMLAGYLPLLRAAARMDAERELHAEHMARSSRSEGSGPSRRYERSEPSGPAEPSEPSAPSEPSERTGRPAWTAATAEDGWPVREGPRAPVPPPDADVIDISAQVGEDFYDQYTDARLRAVGDLSHHPAEPGRDVRCRAPGSRPRP
jgi:hypothetical protein